MTKIISLSRQIEKQLPAELVSFIQTAGEVAAGEGQKLYLVGGVVRDLLLGRSNLDLDLVVEGDAISLARQIVATTGGKLVTHPHFQTAKIRWNKWSVDLTTARSETYDRPGALPRVKPDSLASDLFRRDFTINAMAIELSPGSYGRLIDLYGGKSDLGQKLLRILHEKSFIDDATRIWRGLRYEQRLDFQLEANTLRLLKHDVGMLDTISGDRIRHELELVLKEEVPEKVLHRAEELKVLARLSPTLKVDDWLVEKFGQARQLSRPDSPALGLYLALLLYRLSIKDNEALISRLRLPKALAQTLRESQKLKKSLEVLADLDMPSSRIYNLLHGINQSAMWANYLASDSPPAREHIQLFLTRLRYVKPALSGNDLQALGIAPGPRIKEILQQLLDARLDGKVTTKQGEVEMVREISTLLS